MAFELSFESVNEWTDRRAGDGQKVINIAHPEYSSGALKPLANNGEILQSVSRPLIPLKTE